MSQYYDLNKHKTLTGSGKSKRVFYWIPLVILVLLLIIGFYVWYSSRPSGKKAVVIQKPTNGYYAGTPQRVYENDRFKFKSRYDWTLSTQESITGTKYVFFKTNNNLIEYEFDVYFDNSVQTQPIFFSKQAVNYIVPVTVSDGKMKSGDISERCGDKVPKTGSGPIQGAQPQTFSNVSFVCDVLGSKEVAAAGQVGGSYNIRLNSPTRGPTTLDFVFTNDTSSYFAGTFTEILDSFELK